MGEHDRPLAATPSTVTRRVTEEQMDGLRDVRDNLTDCIKAMRRNINELEDHLALISAQVTTGRTE